MMKSVAPAQSGILRAIGAATGMQKSVVFDRFTVVGEAGVNMLADELSKPHKSIDMELFGLNTPEVVSSVAKSLQAGTAVRALADPENVLDKQSYEVLQPKGMVYMPYGADPTNEKTFGPMWDRDANPRKVHVKAASWDDGEGAWISTASLIRKSKKSTDISGVTHGDAAKAMSLLTTTTYRGKDGSIPQSAATAAKVGVMLNDMGENVNYLTRAYEAVIDNAKKEISVSFKIFEDGDLAWKLAQARKRGVEVTVKSSSKRMDPVVDKILRQSGVTINDDPYGVHHANAIIGDNEVAVFGSGHATTRGLARKGVKRHSRELGVVIDNPDQIKQIRGIIRLD